MFSVGWIARLGGVAVFSLVLAAVSGGVRAESDRLAFGLERSSQALDAADRPAFLQAITLTVQGAPSDASAVAAGAAMMAPWLAADVLTTALGSLPETDRPTAAPAILAAVLIAVGGADADALLAAAKAGAPMADVSVLTAIARRLTIIGRQRLSVHTLTAGGTGTNSAVEAAVTAGRGAVRAAMRAVDTIMGLPPVPVPVRSVGDPGQGVPALTDPLAEPRPINPFLVPSPS